MDYLQENIVRYFLKITICSDIRILEILEDLGLYFLVPHTVIIKSVFCFILFGTIQRGQRTEYDTNLLVNGIIQ